MKLMALAAALALLVFGASPVFAGAPCPGDMDVDGVLDCEDNCSDTYNPGQADTDGDFCGNLCDADYDNSGATVGFADFGAFTPAFGSFDLEKDHTEPVAGPVGFGDFGAFTGLFGTMPGPSGTTPGTTACP